MLDDWVGYLLVGGYRSPDNTVTGGGITYGPSLGYIGAFAGGTNTWTLSGGNWNDKRIYKPLVLLALISLTAISFACFWMYYRRYYNYLKINYHIHG